MEMDVVRELPSVGRNDTLKDLAALAVVLRGPARDYTRCDNTLPSDVGARLCEWALGWSLYVESGDQVPLWEQAPFCAAARADKYVYWELKRQRKNLYVDREFAYWRDVQLLLGTFYGEGHDACQIFTGSALTNAGDISDADYGPEENDQDNEDADDDEDRWGSQGEATDEDDGTGGKDGTDYMRRWRGRMRIRAAKTDACITDYAKLTIGRGSLRSCPTEWSKCTETRAKECARMVVDILVPRIYQCYNPTNAQLCPLLAMLYLAFYNLPKPHLNWCLPEFEEALEQALIRAAVRPPDFSMTVWRLAFAFSVCKMHKNRRRLPFDRKPPAPVWGPRIDMWRFIDGVVIAMARATMTPRMLETLWTRLGTLGPQPNYRRLHVYHYAMKRAIMIAYEPFWCLYCTHIGLTPQATGEFILGCLSSEYCNGILRFYMWASHTQPRWVLQSAYFVRDVLEKKILRMSDVNIAHAKQVWFALRDMEMPLHVEMVSWACALWDTLPERGFLRCVDADERIRELQTTVHEIVTSPEYTVEQVARLTDRIHAVYRVDALNNHLYQGMCKYDVLVAVCAAQPRAHELLFAQWCTEPVLDLFDYTKKAHPFAWIIHCGLARGFKLPKNVDPLARLYDQMTDVRQGAPFPHDPNLAADGPAMIEDLPYFVPLEDLYTTLRLHLSARGVQLP